MVLKNKKLPAKKLGPEQIEYLALVEDWKANAKVTDNLYSLLKDIVNDKDNPAKDNVRRQDFDQLAQDKVLLELNSIFEEYTFATAKDASLTDDVRRDTDGQHTEDSLVYGEIDLRGFCQLLNEIPHTPNDVFYDLGSGSGRAVMAARFIGDFQECIGIELLENLHQLASSVKSLYKFQYQHKLIHQHVQFICSDLLDCDGWWKNGTVVYIPNLLFDVDLMDQIAEKAMKLRSGAHCICLKKFNTTAFDSAFELIQQRPVPMSWGQSNVYVYRRRNATPTIKD